jgi:ATP synthase protein I
MIISFRRNTMPKKGLFNLDARKVAELSSLALVLPSSIAIGLFMGYFLDKLFGTHPWLLITLLLFGVASGFYSLIRGLNKYLDKNKDI